MRFYRGTKVDWKGKGRRGLTGSESRERIGDRENGGKTGLQNEILARIQSKTTVKKRAKKQHEENRVKLGNPRLMKRKCPRKERKKVVVERGKNPE